MPCSCCKVVLASLGFNQGAGWPTIPGDVSFAIWAGSLSINPYLSHTQKAGTAQGTHLAILGYLFTRRNCFAKTGMTY